MARLWQLGFLPLSNHVNLKDQLVITTLKNMRAQGHPYIDIRREGKRLIFFCCLCFAPCYGELNLYNHLNGKRHTKIVADAKETLMKPNRWPFNDGVFFFHNDEPDEADKGLDVLDKVKGKGKLSESSYEDGNVGTSRELVIPGVVHNISKDGNVGTSRELVVAGVLQNNNEVGNDGPSHELVVPGVLRNNSEDGNDGTSHELVIPGVLQNNTVSDLVVKRLGVGLISARYTKDNSSSGIRRIWCEWLGKKDVSSDGVCVHAVPEHDFAIINFSYDYNLGREMIVEDPRYLLPSCSYIEAERGDSSAGEVKAVSSDTVSSDEDYEPSNNLNSKMLMEGNCDQRVDSQVILGKADRKRVLDQFTIASERTCSICMEKFFPRKDVGALLNRRTGKLVCSSRNPTGAFHVFHVSCLVHWILQCEVQTHADEPDKPVVEERPKKRRKRKCKKNEQYPEAEEPRKRPVFCPDCQGSGIDVEVDRGVFERPTIDLGQIFRSKINLCLAHQEWLRSPEQLENCSTGFTYPKDGDGMHVERLASLKVLSFYRVMK